MRFADGEMQVLYILFVFFCYSDTVRMESYEKTEAQKLAAIEKDRRKVQRVSQVSNSNIPAIYTKVKKRSNLFLNRIIHFDRPASRQIITCQRHVKE